MRSPCAVSLGGWVGSLLRGPAVEGQPWDAQSKGVPEGLQPSPAGPQDSLWRLLELCLRLQEGSSKYNPQQPHAPSPFSFNAECKAGFDTWPRSFMLTCSPAGNVPASRNSGQTDLCHRTVGCLQLQDCPGEAGLPASSSSWWMHFLALCLHRCSLCSWPHNGGYGSRLGPQDGGGSGCCPSRSSALGLPHP